MRPRERYSHHGPMGFGDADLLALLLGTGASGQSALQVGAALLARFEGVDGVARAGIAELCEVRGIGPERAVRVHAALELGRRAVRRGWRSEEPVRSASDAYGHLGPPLSDRGHEELHALFLDRRHRPLARRALTRGSSRLTVVDPQQVYREALRAGAASLVLAHNHPSGDPTPSAQDIECTRAVTSAGRVLGIPLLDHLVIGADAFTSLADAGYAAGWAF